MFSKLQSAGFDIQTLHHAEAILQHDMPQAAADIENILSSLSIPVEELVGGGGGEAKLTQRLRTAFTDHGWKKRNIEIKRLVNGREIMSISHEIDHVKLFSDYVIAMEIEWNNKDPFFDRDLESFKRLHADGAISVGVIITRGKSLQANMRAMIQRFAAHHRIESLPALKEFGYRPTLRQEEEINKRIRSGKSFADAWTDAFVSDKFGEATTHWRKLEDRVRRGVGNPCPLVLIGIPDSVVRL